MSKLPPEMIIVWRSDSSAIGPSTSAMTIAAGERPKRRMKKPSTPQASMIATSIDAAVDGERAEDADHDDGRAEHPERHPRDARERRDREDVDDQQHHVAEEHARDQAPRELRVLLHQQRAGLQPPHHEAADEHRRGADPGMPRVSSGTIAPDEAALLAASGPASPAIAPLPNFSGRLRDRLLQVVRHQGGHGRAGARGGTDEEAEERAAGDRVRPTRGSPSCSARSRDSRADTLK